jgi:hypothetical protein
MRRKNNNHKRPGRGSKPIHIEFTDSTASTVAIAGSFNGWRPKAAQLIAKGKTWAKELLLIQSFFERRHIPILPVSPGRKRPWLGEIFE